MERGARRHAQPPEDILAAQVTKAEQALDLLDDEEEMVTAAVEALDKNLTTVALAMSEGTDLTQGEPRSVVTSV